jgi:isocitrate dehydrogenase
MLSVVPLMNGGGLFETGAGGSAPKHVQQLVQENHLRWDSLGEFMALAESFRHLAESSGNAGAATLAETLDRATERLLEENKSPGRKVGQIDNRGSHAFLAYAWAKELAAQTGNPELATAFAPVAEALEADLAAIEEELLAVQGHAVDLGGYYRPDPAKAAAVMRPSERLEAALRRVGAPVAGA